MTDPNDSPLLLCGLALTPPPRWEDHSIYRFLAPPADELGGMPTTHSSNGVRDNIVISTHPIPTGTRPEGFLEAANHNALQQAPSFKVLRSGTGAMQGAEMAWQDTAEQVEGMPVPVFQRHVAVQTGENSVTLIVITAARKRLDALAQTLGCPATAETE